jgi:uncharacterized repeat protein (TIGR02543 family)
VGNLPTPTRAGYTFGGWYTQASGSGTLYDYSTVYSATSGITLYAKWTANIYTLSFDGQSGTGYALSQTVTYGVAVGNLPTPKRAGYTFGGWYTQPNGGGTRYTSTTVYSATSGVKLYARWTSGSGATGVDAQLQATVALYPNPFTSEVHLTGAAGCTLTVVTAAGIAVHTQKVVSAAETIVLGSLPSGVYFFRLEKDGKKAVKIMIND